ncbi:RHS repeat domain-containing protein [Treponema pedis]|uniref:RHS repeat domain-containing protein n=1 Tax=Treponema pedis TaxID=409322 RepID=UPI0020918B6E|nr:RHS repeat-associated core domain-containing protein [Treponema pedis]
MKPKFCIYPQPSYLTFRTAIEAVHAVRQSRTSMQILFAVCIIEKQALTGGKSLACEDKYSKKIGAVLVQQAYRRSFEASAVFNFVFFIMLKNKIEQSAAQRCLRPFELRVLPFGKTSGIKLLNLLNTSTDRTFENRRSRYKELGKKVPQAYRVYVEDTFLPCDAVIARIFSKEMTHTYNQGDNEEQKAKRYYYHSDHLGSAQFVTDWRGKQYEHIEYTPYGELWTYKSKTAKLFLTTYNNFLAKQPQGLIEETAPGIDKLPFRFTGKELDEETSLYYYGARYLDPKYSRWLSGDPALNDYIPKAPIDDEAKKHNENLPGMGGVFNIVNLHVYHYAGNNPVKYTDPDGEDIEESPIISGSLAILLAARGSIGFAKDSNNHIALYIKGELGLGAGTDIDFKQQLSNALGTAGKLLKLLDKGNTALNLIVNAINVPEDTGEGNFNGILQFVPDNYSKWSGNLPTEGAFFIGVQTDKKGRLSFTVGIKAIAAAYFGSGTLYIDLTELKNQGIDELNEMIQSIEYSISNFAYKILRNFFDKELRE